MSGELEIARLITARNLALEIARVTEAAALATYPHIGKGNKIEADDAATEAMRDAFSRIYIKGTVVIGEGELDEAPMLYNGEKVGRWGEHDPEIDIAVDPLEGTNLCAKNRPNAITCVAMTDGKFLQAPDMYMEKIVVNWEAKDVIDINLSPEENYKRVAEAKKKDVADLNVIMLERERNKRFIDAARKLGCKIKFITDGDVAASLCALMDESPMDIYVGIGGSPEGVLSAAAAKSLGGNMQAKLAFDITEDFIDMEKMKERAKTMGITDFEKVYTLDELVSGNALFAASGVTDGELLKGVHKTKKGYSVESIVMRSRTGTVRRLFSSYNLSKTIDYKKFEE